MTLDNGPCVDPDLLSRLHSLNQDRRLIERLGQMDTVTRRRLDRDERRIRAGYPFGSIPAPWEDIVLEFTIPVDDG